MDNKKTNILLTLNLIVLLIILVVVLVISDVKLSNLEDNILSRLSNNDSQINSLNYSMDTMQNNIEEMLKKQASIISDYSITTNPPSDDTLEAKVTLKVTPKEYSENTQAVFYIDNLSVNMTKNGNTFRGTISVPITNDYNKLSVTFSNDGNYKSETLDETIYLRNYLSEFVKISCNSSHIYSQNELRYTGDINYSYDLNNNQSMESIKIFARVNNTKVWQEDVDFNSGSSSQTYNIDKTFTVKDNETLTIFMQFKKSSGLTYVYIADTITVQGGNMTAQGTYQDNIYTIHDKNGNEIYRNEFLN